MPGFVVHLAEAYTILDRLDGSVDFSQEARERFITGNLLPDTRLRGEKHISHFWDPADFGKLAKTPDIHRFLEKYGSSRDPLLLGDLSHLYLDAEYVKNFWPGVFRFYDSKGQPQVMTDRISQVKILKSGLMVPVDEFFSEKYYYGDYTKMNSYFINKYHIKRPQWEQIRDFPMDEVKLSDMSLLCRGLDKVTKLCHKGDEKDIRVFELDKLEAFALDCSEAFIRTYCGIK